MIGEDAVHDFITLAQLEWQALVALREMNGTSAGTYEPYDPSDDRMSMTTPARILVNAVFDMNTPTPLVSGTWKRPGQPSIALQEDLGYQPRAGRAA